MQDDPFLGTKDGLSVLGGEVSNFYQLGFGQLDISEEEISKAGRLIHVLSIIKLEGLRPEKYPAKGVTNDHHRHLQGALFAFGTEGVNHEWREHSASSIREMISGFASSELEFNENVSKYGTNQNTNSDELKKIESACKKIKKYYQFFTGVTHHQQAAITNGFRQLEDLSAENERCLSVDSFKLVFKHFFIDLKKIITVFPDL
ncbi:MAG: hypothetical protein ABA06_01115 [Parcubacteria bacterium C7867-001]|nr:MAG: hypothetical protein ABA06_01115 [Parcubacteria bacterium C7867-001]